MTIILPSFHNVCQLLASACCLTASATLTCCNRFILELPKQDFIEYWGYFLPGSWGWMVVRIWMRLDCCRLQGEPGCWWLLLISGWSSQNGPRKMRNHVSICVLCPDWRDFQPCDGTKLINPSGIHQRSNISLHQSGDVFSSLEDLSLDAEKLEARMYPAKPNTCLLIVEGWMGRQIWVSISVSFYYF